MFDTKSKTTPTLNDFPEYREAVQKRVELQLRRNELQQALSDAQTAYARGLTGPGRIEMEARALLDGDASVATTTAPPPDIARRDAIRRDISVVTKAIDLQERNINELASRVSRDIAQKLRPEYEAIVKRMAIAVETLSAVAEEEALFRQRLDDNSISFSGVIPPVPLEVWRLSVFSSKANLWFDQAREYGVKAKGERKTSQPAPDNRAPSR